MLYRSSTAITLLVVALIAWSLVGFFAWTIQADEGKRVTDAQNAQTAATREAHSVRTRALALDTAKEGTQLKSLLGVDVVSISYMIEEVGKISGVTVKLGDALPENEREDAEDGTPKAVGFIVSADGKFPALMRAAQLFETLPIPSSVTRLDIERVQDAVGQASNMWHMNLYIRVLTTSDISS